MIVNLLFVVNRFYLNSILKWSIWDVRLWEKNKFQSVSDAIIPRYHFFVGLQIAKIIAN